MGIKLMDCTLRDGGNVFGCGFPLDLTEMILDALTKCKVPIIEFGNSRGLGAYDLGYNTCPSDQEYFDVAKKYLDRGSEIGMFLNAKRYKESNVDKAKENGLHFLRVGADAGDADITLETIKTIKKRGMKAYYSVMKAYLLSPEELAEEAKKLEGAGIDGITIMDSAGTMLPDQVSDYVETLKKAISVPLSFHCHNNMGLSAANAVAAYKSGVDILDCGLMGMARSAGNLATEVCIALMHRYGEMVELDLYEMLNFIETQLIPEMKKYDYHVAITPLDLVLGFSGCHSSFIGLFKKIAKAEEVNLFELIIKTSELDRKNPSESLIMEVAQTLKAKRGSYSENQAGR